MVVAHHSLQAPDVVVASRVGQYRGSRLAHLRSPIAPHARASCSSARSMSVCMAFVRDGIRAWRRRQSSTASRIDRRNRTWTGIAWSVALESWDILHLIRCTTCYTLFPGQVAGFVRAMRLFHRRRFFFNVFNGASPELRRLISLAFRQHRPHRRVLTSPYAYLVVMLAIPVSGFKGLRKFLGRCPGMPRRAGRKAIC